MRVDPIHNLLCWCRSGGNVAAEARFWFSIEPPAEILRRRRSSKGRWRMGNQFEIYAPKLRLITYTTGPTSRSGKFLKVA